MSGSCSSCGAPIRWARTVNGKAMPLDADPVPSGNVRLGWIGGKQVAILLTDPAERAAAQIEGPVYLPHFATCPNANEHRKAN